MQDSWGREVRGSPVARCSVPQSALAALAALVALWCALLLPALAPANPAAALTPDEIAAYARLPVCSLSADGLRLAQQPCRTAPARVPMARRRVPQIMDPPTSARTAVPAVAPAAASATASATTPAALAAPASGAVPLPAAPVYLPAPPASPPQALSNCSASGCYDAQGRRLDNAAPGVVITPQGKVCSRNGVWIQC